MAPKRREDYVEKRNELLQASAEMLSFAIFISYKVAIRIFIV